MDLVARWQSIQADPALCNLPYKIELTRCGQILMSPTTNWRGMAQFQVGERRHKKLPGGSIIVECSVLTREGIRVADVAWASAAFVTEFGDRTPFPKAPEICIEVVSPSNSREEIEGKVALYLERGAIEVWIVEKGSKAPRVFGHTGAMTRSRLAPGVRTG